ncbi:hypothetical protein, partial [Ureibacillus aquaedulcis]
MNLFIRRVTASEGVNSSNAMRVLGRFKKKMASNDSNEVFHFHRGASVFPAGQLSVSIVDGFLIIKKPLNTQWFA